MTRTYETMVFERPAEHIGVVTLKRPGGFNSLNTRMGHEGVDLFESMAMNADGLRCLILTGHGDKAFCAGGDLKERNGMSNEAWIKQHVIFERLMRALIECPIPLIGAVNGAAYGGGCEIAACCDFLYAASHAKFAVPEVKLGIMPGGGGTQTLPRALGERRAKELLMTGRAFTAHEALAWGLVNIVVEGPELMPLALETAATIAANAPLSTRQVKQSAGRGLRMSLSDGLAFEIEAYNRLVPTQDRIEGILAFNEKRKPLFTGS